MQKKHHSRPIAAALLFCTQFLFAPELFAEEADPIQKGPYIAPMASVVIPTDHTTLKVGFGGILAAGWRKDFYAIEIAPTIGDLKHSDFYGASIDGLLFPFKSFNAYALIGISGIEFRHYQPASGPRKDFSTVGGDAGLGYILPLTFGDYQFGLRAEARYRLAHRDTDYNDADVDIDAPHRFSAVIFNLGLQLPTRLRHHAEAPVEPVAVVAVADTDGDGVLDDVDQCPDTPHGTAVDEKGCPLPPKPICKTPLPGEKLTLQGCGTGDVIVLNGVNFEFNKSNLTPNAKTILDNVAAELSTYPDIAVEVGGHTDGKGTHVYNQKLSDRRAHAVVTYLGSKGVVMSRMSATGYGETKPIADNLTDEGREMNRRVELKITAGSATPPAAEAAAPAADVSATPPAAP